MEIIMFGTLIFQVIIFLVLFVLPIIFCVWAYKDAIEKGKSGGYALAVCIMILFFPIVGFIVYLCIRNS